MGAISKSVVIDGELIPLEFTFDVTIVPAFTLPVVVIEPDPVFIVELFVVVILPVVTSPLHSIDPVARMRATVVDPKSFIVIPVPVTNPAPDIDALVLPVGIASFIVRLDDVNVVETASTHVMSPTLLIDATSLLIMFLIDIPRDCNEPVVCIKFAFASIAPELIVPLVILPQLRVFPLF